MTSFIISPAAKEDLNKIWEYVSQESPANALKLINEIEAKCILLSEYPYIGHQRLDLTRYPVRFWPLYSYLIVYKENSDPLEIVRILSGYRNLINIF